MYKKSSLINLFVIFIFITSFAFSQTKNNIFSLENRKVFGDYLFQQKDYLRAFDEYKAYLAANSNDTIILKISKMLIEMDRLSEAEDYLKMIFLHSNLRDEAKLNYYFVKFKRMEPNAFREFCINGNNFPEKYKFEINRLAQISYFNDRKYLPDSLELFYYFQNDSTNLADIKKFYYKKYFPENKKPLTAALLSSIIPGLGKIYTKNYSDGITSFIITGVLGYIAYDNFKANHNVRAWILSGVTALFYGGNIYGSAASAYIYNAQLKVNLEGEISSFFSKNNYFIP